MYSDCVITLIGSRAANPQEVTSSSSMAASNKCLFEDVIEEDHLVDLCALQPELVDQVATLLWETISKSKNIKQPYTKLKKWMNNNGRSSWQPGNKKEILCQWVSALCLFVEDFDPQPFVYEQGEPPILIPALVRDILAPKALMPMKEPLRLEDKQPSSIMGSAQYKCAKPVHEHTQQEDNPPPQQQDMLRDMMTSMYGQMHEQSNINAHILEALQDLKEALPGQKKKQRDHVKLDQDDDVTQHLPHTQEHINAEILKSLKQLHTDDVQPKHKVIDKDLCRQIIEMHKGANMSYTTKAAVEAATSLMALYEKGIAMGPEDDMGPMAHSLSTSIQSSMIGAAFPPSQKPQIREKQSLLKQVCGNTLAAQDYKGAYVYASDRGRGGRFRGGGGRGQGRGGNGRWGKWQDHSGWQGGSWHDKGRGAGKDKWKDKGGTRDQGSGP